MQPIYLPLTRAEASAGGENDFASTITRQRRSRRVSIAAIARQLQVSNEEYRRWEEGKSFPKASTRRLLATLWWDGNHALVKQLCKHSRRQRRHAITAHMLRKNNLKLSDLRRFHRDHKTWLSCIKDALSEQAPYLTDTAVTTLRQELTNKTQAPYTSTRSVQNISAALQLNFTSMHTKVKIETVLTLYLQTKEKYGDFLLDSPLRSAFENAATVLLQKDKRSLKKLLAQLSTQDTTPALPLTFGARLRHAEVSLADAAEASGINDFTLSLYYYGLRLPTNNTSILKKICRAFGLTYSRNMAEALRIEEKARKYLQKRFTKPIKLAPAARRVLDTACETIMADYSQLSQRIFRQRLTTQMSMRRATQALRLDFEDYLELEWCMYPSRLVLLQQASFLKRIARFLNVPLKEVSALLHIAAEQREEQQRLAKNAKLAQAAQLAAEAEAEQDNRLSEETPKMAAQRILCLLAEKRITAATLRAFDETFVTHIKATGVCTPAAAAKGKIDAAKIRFFLHGRGFPNDSDLQKICTGYAIKDVSGMQHLIAIEQIVMEYQLAVSQLGKLPLPQDFSTSLEQAAAVKMRDYSDFSRALFKRRAELKLSQLEAARRVGCKDGTDYRKLEWSLTPSFSRTLKKTEMIDAIAKFLHLSRDEVRELISRGADQQLITRGREDTPAAAAWNIKRRLQEHSISIADLKAFDQTFAAHLRASGVSAVEASELCGLDSTRLRQYIDGKGFPIDYDSLEKVCQSFQLDLPQMEKAVNVEKTVRKYMTDTSRLGNLSLPPATQKALEQAVETVIEEFSDFARRLYRRRGELKITQREAAELLGLTNSNSYRKMEQSTAPLLDRGIKKNPQILENIAKFLQMPLDELKELFVEKRERPTHSSAYTLKVTSDRLLDSLQQSNIGIEELHSYEQSFASRLRNSGVSLKEACRRSVFARSKIKPCFEGQHLPNDKYELRQFCSDFSLGDYNLIKQQLDIEKALRDYMAKTTRYGELQLPDDIQAALERGVEVIMADYCELSRLLTQRRTELQLSMEAAANQLGIKTHEYYRKMERSIGALPSGALRGNPNTIPRMAEFLQINVERLRELIADAGADDDDETPTVVEDEQTLALREATTEIIKQLGEKGITPDCLRAFEQTFASHLRTTGIDPQQAAARVDMDGAAIASYLRGERTPHDEHEFHKICTAFSPQRLRHATKSN